MAALAEKHHAWFVLLTRLLVAMGDATPPNGLSSCPCLGASWSPADTHPNSIQNGMLIFKHAGTSYSYPLTYGQNCGEHDKNLPPLCNSLEGPDWCYEPWCYVDTSNCNVFNGKSQFFPNENNLYYSYATCQAGRLSNSFELWAQQGLSNPYSRLLPLLQGYLQASRHQIEDAHKNIGSSSETCVVSSMCPCLECLLNQAWNQRIDFRDVGVFQPEGRSSDASCLDRAIAFVYRRVASKEGIKSNVGYQYFGDQQVGSYVNWPNIQWCPSSYDPRFRPWYASGSTGPKDVVIVVDVSGSMLTASRITKAKAATKAILDTLTWKDFATILLFNHGVKSVYSNRLVAVTDARRAAMNTWVDSGVLTSGGGTNFQAALLDEFSGAFKIIADSVQSGDTSMCQKIIMFLTDGEASFTEEDFSTTRRLATQYDTIIFSYALGSGADTTTTKRLACENRGIFYPVADTADLSSVMADYYSYFAEGQQSCTSSFVEYKDKITDTSLYAGCLPIYDRTTEHATLLGVSCMDVNMLTDIHSLKRSSGWSQLVSIMSDVTKTCLPLYLSECQREKLRLKYSQQSVCSSTASASLTPSCPCLEQDCADDPSFIDEKGYFCDTWVGDSCDTAVSAWGYSSAGEAQIKAKCKHSCGLCAWLSPCPYTNTSCSSSALPTRSRACQTAKITGVNIEGSSMACCDPTSSRYDSVACNSAAQSPVPSGAPSPVPSPVPSPMPSPVPSPVPRAVGDSAPSGAPSPMPSPVPDIRSPVPGAGLSGNSNSAQSASASILALALSSFLTKSM
eukprot:TRINITY_DN19922_c0_g1_i1.p1 TRINITY_DN19922_c0_g1~~TRINITY_DN19922_c0_g1_i1.p1  ORF type:complete len:791 (-),score=91.88 TRINITY_DN19922_c0_g1_i1:397-2769(-)